MTAYSLSWGKSGKYITSKVRAIQFVIQKEAKDKSRLLIGGVCAE